MKHANILKYLLAAFLGGLFVLVLGYSGVLGTYGQGNLFTLSPAPSTAVLPVEVHVTDENYLTLGNFKKRTSIQVLGTNYTTDVTRLAITSDGVATRELEVRNGTAFRVDFDNNGTDDYKVTVSKLDDNSSVVFRVSRISSSTLTSFVQVHVTDENYLTLGNFKKRTSIQVLGTNYTTDVTRLAITSDGVATRELEVRNGTAFRVDFDNNGTDDYKVTVSKLDDNSSVVFNLTRI